MKKLIYALLISTMITGYGCSNIQHEEKNIVILVGQKSHPAGQHEYIKTARLLKAMLDNSPNLNGVNTKLVYNDWPEDPSMCSTRYKPV